MVSHLSFFLFRSLKVVDLGVQLLLDKSNLVRKSAVQLLVELLQWNSFAPTVSNVALITREFKRKFRFF